MTPYHLAGSTLRLWSFLTIATTMLCGFGAALKTFACDTCEKQPIEGYVTTDLLTQVAVGGLRGHVKLTVGSYVYTDADDPIEDNWIDASDFLSGSDARTQTFSTQGPVESFKVALEYSKVWDEISSGLVSHDSVTVGFQICGKKITIDGQELDEDDPEKQVIDLTSDNGFNGWAWIGGGWVTIAMTTSVDILSDTPRDWGFSLNVSLKDGGGSPPGFGDGGSPGLTSGPSSGPSPMATMTVTPHADLPWDPVTPDAAASISAIRFPASFGPSITFVDASSTHKQLYKAGSGVIDVAQGSNTLAVDYYSSGTTTLTPTGGVYVVSGTPTKRILVEQIASDQFSYKKILNGSMEEHYTYTETWSATSQILDKVNNLNSRKDVYETTWPGSGNVAERHQVFQISGTNETLLSDIRTTNSRDGWILSQSVDPDGEAWAAEWTYDGSGKPISVVYSDGYWEKYDYTGDAITATYCPFKDSPANPSFATAANCKYVTEVSGVETTKILGQTVLVRTTSSSDTTSSGFPVKEETVVTTPAGSPASTEITRQLRATGTARLDGRLQSVQHADGTTKTITYDTGTYNPSTNIFTTGSGAYLRTVSTAGYSAHPEGIAFRTLRTTSVEDDKGHTLLEDTAVFTGSGSYEFLNRQTHDYITAGLVESKKDGRTTYSAEYDSGKVSSEKDEYGTETVSTYDDLGRLATSTIVGLTAYSGTGFNLAALPDQKTSYNYDVLDREILKTRGESPLTVTEATAYSVAGNIASTTIEDGKTTTYVYTNGGRTLTTTFPNGATKVEDLYCDRTPKSTTGTGVVAEYFDYGVWTGSDSGRTPGTTWMKKSLGTSISDRYTLETYDGLDRLIRSELPPRSSQVYAENHSFDERNLETKVDFEPSGGKGAQIFVYDDLAMLSRQGIDMDFSGTLSNVSADRILEFENYYEKVDDKWWRIGREKEFLAETDTTSTVRQTTREKVTGFATNEIGRSEVIDILDRQSSVTLTLDRAHACLKKVFEPKGCLLLGIDYIRNGLLQSQCVPQQSYANLLLAKATRFFHDSLGREVLRIEPRDDTEVASTYVENSLNLESTDRGGVLTMDYEYYPAGSGANTGQVKSVAENGVKTNYTWTLKGELYRVWGAQYPAEYSYDGYGALSSMKTFRSQTTSSYNTWSTASTPLISETLWSYDADRGNLIGKTDAAAKGGAYSFDIWNRLTTRTWARGVVTAYSYNAADQLVATDYSNATPDVAISYNRRGLRDSVSDVTGTRGFTYTADGLVDVDQSGFGHWTIDRVFKNYPLSTTFSGSFSHKIDHGKLADFQYNLTGDIERELISGFGYEFVYDYSTNLPSEFRTQNSVSIEYRTDSVGRATSTYISNPFFDNFVWSMSYDSASRLSNFSFSDGSYWQFIYNGRSEVKEGIYNLTNSTPMPPFDSYQYSYDDIGNRLESLINSALTSYDTNSLNQYESIERPGVTDAPTYDDDGNIQSDGKWIYEWDGENRLISLTSTPLNSFTKQIVFQYDSDCRRVSKSIFNWSGSSFVPAGNVAQYAYDGMNLVSEFSISGTTATLLKTFKWLPYVEGISTSRRFAGGVGALFEIRDCLTGDAFVPVYDHNGNVMSMMEQTSSLEEFVAFYKYDPFGQRISFSSAWSTVDEDTNPFQFSTKYLDKETGFYNYGYRYYDPKNGRWLNRDPLEERGGINLYNFVGNSPLLAFDVLGLDPVGNWVRDQYLRRWFWQVFLWADHPVRKYSDGGNTMRRFTAGDMDAVYFAIARAEIIKGSPPNCWTKINLKPGPSGEQFDMPYTGLNFYDARLWLGTAHHVNITGGSFFFKLENGVFKFKKCHGKFRWFDTIDSNRNGNDPFFKQLIEGLNYIPEHLTGAPFDIEVDWSDKRDEERSYGTK